MLLDDVEIPRRSGFERIFSRTGRSADENPSRYGKHIADAKTSRLASAPAIDRYGTAAALDNHRRRRRRRRTGFRETVFHVKSLLLTETFALIGLPVYVHFRAEHLTERHEHMGEFVVAELLRQMVYEQVAAFGPERDVVS